MTLEEKINRLRETTEKYRKNTNAEPQNSFEAEAKKVEEHEAEKNKQLADWLEELKRYKDLEEQGRLLVLPCKVGEHPEETYLTQFLKHYPNAPLDDDGTPKVCVNELGFTRDDECTALNCINCWNTPIEEE